MAVQVSTHHSLCPIKFSPFSLSLLCINKGKASSSLLSISDSGFHLISLNSLSMLKWGKEMEKEMVEVRFRQGQDIEIGSNEIGFKGSWYSATVLHSSNTPSRSASKIVKKVYVQYQTLMKDEQGSNPLTEYVAISRVRPQPPPDEEIDNGSFEEDEEVEAFYNDGWWEGTIMQVLGNQKYRVFFKVTNEEIEFHQSEIRRQRNWINGKWVLAQKVEEVPIPLPAPVTLTPKNQSRIRSPRATQSSHARKKSKVENQSTPKKKKRQSSFNSDAGFSRPCKKLKTAEEMKTLLSLITCSMRAMSSGKSTEVDGRNDFTISTTKGKRTSVSRKRKSYRGLAAIFLDLSSEEYNKDHPEPLDSYQKKPKDALESNGSGDHSSVQDCSSQPPLNTIEVPQHKLVHHPKTKVLVQTTTKDSGTKAAVKGGKHKGAQGSSQNPAAHTQTHTIGLEQTTPSKETTIVVYREDTSKGTEKDGASSESSDLDQPLSMLFRESCLKGRVQRQKKFKVRPQKQERKPLGGDNMKLQIMEKGGNQTIDVCNRRRQTAAKDSSTETAVNGEKHKSARRRSSAPAAQTQTQTIGLERTTPSKETTIVVHRGDTLKETEKDGASGDIRDLGQPLLMLLQEPCLKGQTQRQKLKVRPSKETETEKDGASGDIRDLDQPPSMLLQESCLKGQAQRQKKLKVRPSKETETEMDGASSDIRDLDQPLSMLLQESCLPPIIGEKGVPSDSQPTIQSVEAINLKGAATRGIDELQKSSIVVESSLSLEHITADTELDVAARDEHNDMHLSWPFVKCSPLWEFVESLEVFRSMPQKLHFHPLEEYNMDLREGLAIACMVNFSNLVENMRKSQIEDPLSQLQSWSKALDDLEGHGFNVQPIRARLEKLTSLKVNYEDFVGKTMSAEEQIRVLNDKREQLAARLVEVDKEIRDRAEIINQLKKQLESTKIEKELHDSKMSEITTRRHQIREGIDGVELKFDQNVAAPW